MAYLKINTLNVLPYLESGGVKWGSEDVIGKTVTTLDGVDHIDILRTKRTLKLTFPDLADEYAREILSVVSNKSIIVTTDLDPLIRDAIYTMHCDSQSTDCSFIYENGLVKWSGLEFDLEEF